MHDGKALQSEPHTTLVTASLRHSASSTQTRTINYSTVMRHHGAFQHVLSELSSWFTEMTSRTRCFPKIAPTQVMVIPIQQQKDGVLDKAYDLKDKLKGFPM